MAVSWINFLNGDTGLNIRNALNTFNTNVTSDLNIALTNITTLFGTTSTHTSAIAANVVDIGINEVDIADNVIDIVAAQGDILDLESPDTTQYVPQAVKPTHIKGQLFYSDECQDMCVCTDIADTHISLGQMSSMRVNNTTGSTIVKGAACTYDGALGGYPLVKLAIADNFRNAIILGVALHDIPTGTTGFLVTHGKIWDMNTNGFTAGVPLYLSDTVPGTMTESPGNIISQVGGSTQVGITDGKFFVNLRSNIVFPTVLGVLEGVAVNTYNLTAIAQAIKDYVNETSVILPTVKADGTIEMVGTGTFRGSFVGAYSFTSVSSTRTIYFELYNVTTASIIGDKMARSIPRDATEDSFSFSAPFNAADGDVIVMRISSVPDMDISFTAASFDVESIHVR